jgi:agmatinase
MTPPDVPPPSDFPEFNPDDLSGMGVFTKRPDLQGDRPPGLIDLRRYMFQMGMSGFQTFVGAPIALTPADLRAAGVEVAMIGAGLDFSYGMRGSAYGPKMVRNGEIYMPPGYGTPHQHTRVDPVTELVLADYGDAPVNNMSLYASIEPIRALVREVAETGAIPFIVGGDHSLMYPNVAAMADVFGKAKVGVIHFDAHYDATDAGLGLNLTHGTPVRRLIEQGHASGHNFIQVGTRGWAPNDKDLGWMRDHGFRYHNMAQVDKFGWDWVMDRAIEEASDGTDYLYISIDMDVFDPAFAPGTGTPEPNGLTPREMFPILRRLGAEKNVVGVELVELNPFADSTYATGLIANRVIREVLTGIAMRKKGITEPYYFAEAAIDGGQGQDWPRR